MEVYGKNAIYLNMDISATYTTAITPLIPFFSAIACGILVAFSLQDCLKREGEEIEKARPFLFLHVRHRVVCHVLLRVRPSTVRLAEYSLPRVLRLAGDLFLPGHPFSHPARATGEF